MPPKRAVDADGERGDRVRAGFGRIQGPATLAGDGGERHGARQFVTTDRLAGGRAVAVKRADIHVVAAGLDRHDQVSASAGTSDLAAGC
jgi:hypothetical protein